jgi:hypothetical protein
MFILSVVNPTDTEMTLIFLYINKYFLTLDSYLKLLSQHFPLLDLLKFFFELDLLKLFNWFYYAAVIILDMKPQQEN